MNTDPIADFLTRIRNACFAKHKLLKIPSSKLKKELSKVLLENGYILDYKLEKKDKEIIKIALKYFKNNSVIQRLIRISKPGLRKYTKYKNIPRVLNGLGIAIISTSYGIITDKQARKKRLGGEILCYVY
ncbi:30S ribosomal protein S8 [Blattabacterium punctulatus]|uniref:Small ribosomal subunit protein uS8 n=1 Tax=Blattabacterium punctulatus TaxID=164514 RepID=A0ABM6WMI4_9FLAO|nr:30S ribosomal protein S8 [Blattabacterium punctulatus]AWU39802.1 30S ribosomal protein S8 [Blattabacterium punctulatus]AWU40346.1 30S ribosomal protein S8 [Blattabacterium punctulatus]AWU44799.1 30S ribosomal protein S8 [Blattabacterium punctulatus]